jgi:ankyrin repeat protein
MIHGSKFSHAATVTIQLVIQHGVDIQTRDKYGETALSIAIKDRTDDMYVAKVILRQYQLLGIPVDPSLIFPAIESSSFNNSCSKITEVLKYGFEQTLHNSDGNAPLHHCVIKSATAALRKLVTFPSINLDLRNRDGFTPLHLASKIGSIDCLAILCENGASVNSRVDNSEDVALTLALASGNTDVFYVVSFTAICQITKALTNACTSYSNITQIFG